MPLAGAIGLGLLLGWLSGGSVGRIGTTEPRFPPALLLLFIMQGLARGRFGGEEWASWGMLVWAWLSACIVAYVLLRHRMGELVMMAVGVMMNLLVVLANGYMPVVPSVLGSSAKVLSASGFYAVADSSAALVVLADVVPLPLFGATYYLSTGDVVLAVGAAALLIRLMTEDPQAGLTPPSVSAG